MDILNREICDKCEYLFIQFGNRICARYAFTHSASPIDDDINEEAEILNECPYKLEHVVTMQEVGND